MGTVNIRDHGNGMTVLGRSLYLLDDYRYRKGGLKERENSFREFLSWQEMIMALPREYGKLRR